MDIKYAFYNTSKGYRVLGGTAAHFLKADGSLDSSNYISTSHPVYGINQNDIINWKDFLGYSDTRQIRPNHLSTKKLNFGFTSWNNDNMKPWADYLHFGGYPDTSGGNQNLIMFNKNGFGLRQYQDSSQDTSPYQDFVDYLHTGNFNPSNYVPYVNATQALQLGANNLVYKHDGSTVKVENSVAVFDDVYQGYYDVGPHIGVLSIKLPLLSTSTMLSMDISFYGYGISYVGKVNVSFYIYNNQIYNGTGRIAIFETTDNFPTNQVRVGVDSAGKISICFGDSSTNWDGYFSFKVDKLTTQYGGWNNDWNKGWSHGLENGLFTGYPSLITPVTNIVATKSWVNSQNGNFVDKTSNQYDISGHKQFNNGISISSSQKLNLKGYNDPSHYIANFSDDTDGFGVSTGFAVKPYNDVKINLFKVDSNGNSFTLETHKTKKLISNYTGTTSDQNLGSGGIGNTLELRNYDLYGTNFWTNDWGDGHIQQQRFDGNQVAYNLKLQPLGGLLYYGNNLVATENQIPDVSSFTTYNFLAQNYALRAGSNATDTWAHTSYGLSINPYIPGKTFNAAGACYLQEATYGSAMGYLNSSGTGAGNPTNDWWFRLKMLHSNAGGYYGEIGVKMTGGTNSLRYKRFENGVDGGWVEVWDKQNLTQGNINNWNFAYNGILSDVLNFNNNQGDYTRYYKVDGSSFDRLRIGTGIVDTRVTGNGLGSDGSNTFVPNSGNNALNHKLLPLFHEVSGRGYQSSLILKGWTDTYRAWRITGPADVGNQEEDFFLNQTMSDTGDWMKERKIWTDKHFTQANINSWNNFVSSSGIQLNVEFTTNTGSGLVISDHSVGDESGIIDTKEKKFVATKRKDYYFYGSDYDGFSGLNFQLKSKLFGMGRQANKVDKLTVEGSVKASKNFKSEKEDPNTIFIPNGRLASLRDEIVNDQSDYDNYAIRLDPHEYEIDAFTFLQVDDRNRLIHIIGEQVEMGVNFNKIYPKQQIVIYNFDQKENGLEVQIEGKTIYKIESRCFIRLYVTRSLRVIIERQQPCDIW